MSGWSLSLLDTTGHEKQNLFKKKGIGMKQVQAKHKMCRRLGYCIWGAAKCPSAKRPYAAGQQGKNAKKKTLSTYGVMMQEKQKLKAHYCLTEKQLRNIFLEAKRRPGQTNEVLMHTIF